MDWSRPHDQRENLVNYIPPHIASLQLDELRRQADVERRSRQAPRLDQPARTVPARRQPLHLRVTALGRAVTQG